MELRIKDEESEGLGLTDDRHFAADEVLLFVLELASHDVVGAVAEHGVDHAGEPVGGGGDGFWHSVARGHATEEGAES